MLKRFMERRHDEEGFTLIELMVVILIIGILIAIALPTFLGARTRAQEKVAQSSLRNALSNAKVIYTDNNTYSGANAAGLTSAEPSLTFRDSSATPGNSDSPRVVSVTAGTSTWGAAAKSDSGKCFYIYDPGNAPVLYGSDSAATCTGANAATVATSSSGF